MRRREFIAFVGGAAAWPLAAHAQQPAMPVIGFLSSQSPDSIGHVVAAFRQGLNEAGFVESHNIAIEYRWAEGHYDRLPALATELVRRQVAVIAAAGSPLSALAAKSATATIPIVFDTNDDPVKLGLVASFNRPGGNLTGVSFFTITLDAKRLELLHDLLASKTVVIGVLINPDNPNTERVLPEIKKAARALGLQYHVLKANSELDLDAVFASLVGSPVNALLVSTDPFFTVTRNRLVALAARYAIPTIYGRREFAAVGGLAL
jgi:putative ABC transport system substrate-binding protein